MALSVLNLTSPLFSRPSLSPPKFLRDQPPFPSPNKLGVLTPGEIRSSRFSLSHRHGGFFRGGSGGG
ncbi:hypothetical protein DY000_02018187 [Brassica cretica]|uniref:Uncharacterized protein n=1 Tax=Brassica cretica TaxID=69181 RepID=A0ABQ7CNZ2_BRACR|nr:hypothetical protein DY000_02018187 [Brassica cretica]